VNPRASAQRWFFDGWSRFYDFAPIQRATYRPIHEAALRKLADLDVRDVLDVGCGTGQLTARLRETHPDARVVGCDFSRGMLLQAAQRRRRALWVQADAARLPFPASAFDAVVSTEAFHWFPDQDAALREFFRVVRPGGVLLVALVNTHSRPLSTAIRFGSRLLGEPFYWPTTEEMARWVEQEGFRVIEQRRVFRFPGGLLLPPVLTHAVKPAVP
jgi:ubiquinone/menaquinone biosynthesis C-methylase UbiE